MHRLHDHGFADSRGGNARPDRLDNGAGFMAQNGAVPVHRRLIAERVLRPRVIADIIAQIRPAHAARERPQNDLARFGKRQIYGFDAHGFGRDQHKSAGSCGRRGS